MLKFFFSIITSSIVSNLYLYTPEPYYITSPSHKHIATAFTVSVNSISAAQASRNPSLCLNQWISFPAAAAPACGTAGCVFEPCQLTIASSTSCNGLQPCHPTELRSKQLYVNIYKHLPYRVPPIFHQGATWRATAWSVFVCVAAAVGLVCCCCIATYVSIRGCDGTLQGSQVRRGLRLGMRLSQPRSGLG